MKKITLPLACFWILCFQGLFFKPLSYAGNLPSETALQQAYTQCMNYPSSQEVQLKFFDAFPNSFAEFKAVFGYEEDAQEKMISKGYLYADAVDYVSAFFQLNQISTTHFNQKCIQIILHGQWQADCVNYFLHHLRKRVLAKPEDFAALLEKLKNEEQQSFWYMLYDGPHPPENSYPELEVLQKNFSKIYANMIIGMKQAQYNAFLSHDELPIKQIKSHCMGIDISLNRFEKVEKDSFGTYSEGARFIGYFEKKQVRKIKTAYLGHTGNLQEELYFQNGEIIFIRIKDTRYKLGSYVDSTTIENESMLDIFYQNDEPIEVIYNGEHCKTPLSKEIETQIIKGLINSKEYLKIFSMQL